MSTEPVGYFLYNEEYEEWEETHAGTPNSVPLYANPVNPYQSITDTKIEPTVVSYTHPAKEHFEDEPQAVELHEILQSNAELTDDGGKVCARCGAIAYDPVITQTVKEPTDEEILSVRTHPMTNIEFARAILR